jgi:cytochrome c peroxidase
MTRALVATALALWLGPTFAHEAPAPGYGALGYPLPAPGSYQLPPLGEAADGEVLGTAGQALSLRGILAGRVSVLSFVYRSCHDVNGCPLAVAVLQRIRQASAGEPRLSDQLRLISLSFDPERDTPERMAELERNFRFGDGGAEWVFLTTASQERLAPILDAYGQAVVRELSPDGAESGTLAHVLRVFLIDREGRIRNIYSPSFLHPDLVLNDVRTLLLEEAPAPPRKPIAAATAGPGDDKDGYERADYATRSRSLDGRRGGPTDLLANLEGPALGLPPSPTPEDGAVSAEGIALGRKLFFDRRLSLNGTFSCAMCHIPEQGFTSNELKTAVGIEGRTVRRNAPTLYNSGHAKLLFHDGRETRLKHQAWGPLLAANEMGNPSIASVIEKIRRLDDYHGLFEAAFGRGPDMETLGIALASYQRALRSADAPFDRWYYGGDPQAVGDAVKRGFALFVGKGGCAGCHRIGPRHALFTDDDLHNTGVGYRESMAREPASRRVTAAPGVALEVPSALIRSVSDPPPSDLGRYEISQDPADRWKYKTPSLRNVALTAPYMHNGSLGTLAEVIDFYDGGGVDNPLLDTRIRPLGFSAQEKEDLLALLRALTGSNVDALVADAFAAPVGDAQSDDPAWWD